MYQTRKQLKERIKRLEEMLEHEKSINRLRETSGLSSCTGVICKSCEHAVFIPEDMYHDRLIGCDMTVSCPNYTKKAMK